MLCGVRCRVTAPRDREPDATLAEIYRPSINRAGGRASRGVGVINGPGVAPQAGVGVRAMQMQQVAIMDRETCSASVAGFHVRN